MSPITDITTDLTVVSAANSEADLVNDDDEILIEEISIDGMCGVY